tara:strand:- start:588 stop:701 length:114 start_codon:yes stop_codon:yes gene_type:complete
MNFTNVLMLDKSIKASQRYDVEAVRRIVFALIAGRKL